MEDLSLYTPDICDGDFCPMNCGSCPNADLVLQAMEDEYENGREEEDGNAG